MVTPCVGVWIETDVKNLKKADIYVTPCVGVWIETSFLIVFYLSMESHPAWVCGLKLNIRYSGSQRTRHTLRGCVD